MKRIFILFAILLFVACENDNPIVEDNFQDLEKSAEITTFPDVIPLPNGFQPEGIAISTNHQFYVGSITTGQIYKGDLQTGEGEVWVIPSGPSQTAGLAFDKRSGYIYAAKGFSGSAAVYNSKTGELLQAIQLAQPGASLINDVTVTSNAVYFTNSLTPELYKIPLSRNGALTNPAQIITLPLTGDFSMEPNPMIPQLGAFSNGIDATPNGKHLFLANTGRGEIYQVNSSTGVSTTIDLGGTQLPFADGILLDDEILYVVQNMINQIAVIQLNDDLKSGAVVQTIHNSDFGVPTTIAEFGNQLYAVNAHFNLAPPTGSFPDVEFEVVKVQKFD